MKFASLVSVSRGLVAPGACPVSKRASGSVMRLFLMVFSVTLGSVSVAQTLSTGRPGLAYDLELAAGNYSVNIQDLNFPAPLTDFDAAIIEQTTILAQTEEPGIFEFTSNGEAVVLQIFAQPDDQQSVGSLSVEIQNVNDEVVFSDVATVDTEIILGTTVSREYPLSLSEPQDIQVALNDLLIPQGFDSLGAFLFGSGGVLLGQIQPGQSVPFSLPAGDYRLLVAAEAPSEELGGSLSVNVSSNVDTEMVVSDVVQLGMAVESQTVELEDGSVTLSAFDAAFPSPLSSFSAVLTGPGVVLNVDQNNPSSTGMVDAGSFRLLTYATPDQAAEGGTFGVDVRQQDLSVGGGVAYVPMVDASDRQVSSSFVLDAPQTVELSVSDFGFPATVQNLTTVLIGDQGLLASLIGDGAVTVDLMPGSYELLSYADTGEDSSGLYAVEARTLDGASLVDTGTQVVGAVGESGTIEGVAGQTITIDLIDIGFPAKFAGLSLAVTREGETIGFVFGEGSFSFDVEQSGTYTYTLLATPDADKGAGLYDVDISSAATAAPPPPPPAPPAPTPPTPPTSSGGGGATSLLTSLLMLGFCVRRSLVRGKRADDYGKCRHVT